MFRHQLAAAGPLSRHDLAWWSGLGLTTSTRPTAAWMPPTRAPTGVYHDLPDAPPATLAGASPEFDALFCAFDPAGRARFVDPEHYDVLWKQENGLLLAPVLLDDRLRGRGAHRRTGPGEACTSPCSPARARPRGRRPDRAIVALELALGITIDDVRLN